MMPRWRRMVKLVIVARLPSRLMVQRLDLKPNAPTT